MDESGCIHLLTTPPTAFSFKKAHAPKPFKTRGFYAKPINDADHLVTAVDDATHSRQRKILSHSFSDKALKDQEPMLKFWAEKLKMKLLENAEAGRTVDVLKFFNCAVC